MPRYASVLITGASSGIGRALAEACAAPGVTLHLSGRDMARLNEAAAACAARGATPIPRVLDVRDGPAMADWIAHAGPLDLVIANAGISGGTGRAGQESPAQTDAIFATNVGGVLNTVQPALAAMRTQPPDAEGWRGRIGVIASIASFVPAPQAPAYCAAKAAVDRWTVATAANARAEGVQLTSVCPGYVRSAMTARNQFAMPGLMDADRAAGIILDGIARGKTRVVFPWWLGLAARLGGLLPPRLLAWLIISQPAKAPLD
jgi:short-subunit dehydrogenase